MHYSVFKTVKTTLSLIQLILIFEKKKKMKTQ